jgi:peptidoglycan/LPS O-acetylase OafA/YrhL
VTAPTGALTRMGQQPGLDGLRGLSVLAVIAYHAGFSAFHGGFLGVEVFFVVSGYLITTLLLEEHERSATVSLRSFWVRRARRLLPALAVVLVATTVWVLIWGSPEQASQMRRDLPWAVGYLANWGQILGDVPYFASADPPLLRHLWSLAVEEQWYVVWPLVFIWLLRRTRSDRRRARLVVVGAVVSYLVAWWAVRGGSAPMGWPVSGADRINFAYLSTPTRASGLLLGAAAAFVWRPWRRPGLERLPSRPLDLALGISLGVLVSVFIGADLTAGYMYPWVLALTAIASLVAIGVVVHPAASGARVVLGNRWIVAVGRRSYGLYLWHWPVFVVVGATEGGLGSFLVASAVTVVLSEVAYRTVEVPMRSGALGRWWTRRAPGRRAVVVAVVASVVSLSVAVAAVDEFDPSIGGKEQEFVLTPADEPSDDSALAESVVPTTLGGVVGTSTIAPSEEVPSASTSVAPIVASTTTLPLVTPAEPVRLVVLGDSQAGSLAVNLPSGIEEFFEVVDGSSDGCSIHESGIVRSSLPFALDMAMCEGVLDRWERRATAGGVALVVLGAWDVLDLEVDGVARPFASLEWNAIFVERLDSAVSRVVDAGATVALLEVACMRPVDVEGAGVPALPERGDDARVTHLNSVLAGYAEATDGVVFVEGPDAWCADEVIATDLDYRWDGVHVYRPGAKLIIETVAPALLALAAVE